MQLFHRIIHILVEYAVAWRLGKEPLPRFASTFDRGLQPHGLAMKATD